MSLIILQTSSIPYSQNALTMLFPHPTLGSPPILTVS